MLSASERQKSQRVSAKPRLYIAIHAAAVRENLHLSPGFVRTAAEWLEAHCSEVPK